MYIINFETELMSVCFCSSFSVNVLLVREEVSK